MAQGYDEPAGGDQLQRSVATCHFDHLIAGTIPDLDPARPSVDDAIAIRRADTFGYFRVELHLAGARVSVT